MVNINIFDNFISKLDQIKSLKQVRKGEVNIDFTTILKNVYDFTKEKSYRKTNALPELIIQNFDKEQIWQQIELQNNSEETHLSNNVSKVLIIKPLTIPVSFTKESVQTKNDENQEENDTDSNDTDLENENKLKSSLKKKKIKQKKKTSIVDDKFFKLQELDEYLNKEEKKKKQNDLESDDESIDYFNDFSEEEEDKNDEKKYANYTDFFDGPESENEQNEENINSDYDDNVDNSEEDGMEIEEMSDNDKEEKAQQNKKVRFNLTNDSTMDEIDSLNSKANQERHEEEDTDEEEDEEPKSSTQIYNDKMQMTMKKLEEQALDEKHWAVSGEIKSSNRPQNSILEEFLEYNVNIKPAPVITEETTLKLEDIIKQRIKDNAWDDVEKKFKPVMTPLEYRKTLVLDQQKSKESLSQIYEKEYLKQKQALDPENNEKKEPMPELHNEIKQMMRSLMYKLDALSNYHYTPKRVKPEIKIISNMPAINMEEVAPVATSEAVLLAPEEVKAKLRGDLIGTSERSKTDMKRERRQKKMMQRAKQQAAEEKEKEKTLTTGIRKKHMRKNENTALVKKLIKDRKVTKMSETTQNKSGKFSTTFFTKLQDQIKMQKPQTKKKDNQTLSAIKLKL